MGKLLNIYKREFKEAKVIKRLLFSIVALTIMLSAIASVFITSIAATDNDPITIQDFHWWSNVSGSTPDSELLLTPGVNALSSSNSFTLAEASAHSLTIPASKDAAIGFSSAWGPDSNYGNRISFVAWNNSPKADLNSLLEFSLDSIPANACIYQADLALYCFNSGSSSAIPVGVYKQPHTDWEELQATYNIYKTGSSWTTQGGDYVTSDPVGTVMMVPPASQGFVQWSIIDIVNDARTRGIPLELLIKATAHGNDYSDVGFCSKEYYQDTWLQPKLIIGYYLEDTPTPTPTATPWSFAIITDLHVGEHEEDGDFGTATWNDNGNYSGSENEWSLQNLREAILAINESVEHNNKDNIQFVVILGDFTNSAELSELKAAQDELDKLQVPWIPLIGNHDIWPYTGASEAEYPLYLGDGNDKYFYDNFSDQYQQFISDLGIPFHWGWNPMGPSKNTEADPIHYSYFQNFAFDYMGYHFVGLDFNSRHHASTFLNYKGVDGTGNLYDFSGGTWYWFQNHIEAYISSSNGQQPEKNIILLSHHPFISPYANQLQVVWCRQKHHELQEAFGFTCGELDSVVEPFLDDFESRILIQFSGHYHPGDPIIGSTPFSSRNAIKRELFDMSWSWLSGLSNNGEIMPCVTIPGNLHVPWVQIVKINPNLEGEEAIDYQKHLLGKAVIFETDCPVDLIITDPNNLVISKELNEITGARYLEYDRNGDGSLDDLVWIRERMEGNYKVEVFPESGANLSDIYTLRVSPIEDQWGYTPIILAEHVSIVNIPSYPYIYEAKERASTKIIYTGDLSGCKLDTINLSACMIDSEGNSLENNKIDFTIGNQSISALTDSNGLAKCFVTLNQSPSSYYYLEYSYDGDMDFLPYYGNKPFEILNKLPIAVLEAPLAGTIGIPMTFNASGSYDPDGVITVYNWNFGDGSPTINSTLTPSHTYTAGGNYTVTLTVTDDDGGTGVDTLVVNVIPATTIYTFASGGGTNKWCGEGHVHLIDWNNGHPTSPADFKNSYGYIAGSASTYPAVSSPDNIWWRSSISHDLGCCAFDRNCELYTFKIAENTSTITNIQIKWEGHGTIGETIYYTTEKLWNAASNSWDTLNNKRNIKSDVIWTTNISSNCSRYIDVTGNISILVSAQRSGLPNNCGIWTDYVEVIITHNSYS